MEEYKVYGYITNTRVKIIVVVEDEHVRDMEVKSVRNLPFGSFAAKIVKIHARSLANGFLSCHQRC